MQRFCKSCISTDTRAKAVFKDNFRLDEVHIIIEDILSQIIVYLFILSILFFFPHNIVQLMRLLYAIIIMCE